MPYIYSLAGMTHFNDYTIMRPLVMDFAADKAVRDIKDQYMFGPAIHGRSCHGVRRPLA